MDRRGYVNTQYANPLSSLYLVTLLMRTNLVTIHQSLLINNRIKTVLYSLPLMSADDQPLLGVPMLVVRDHLLGAGVGALEVGSGTDTCGGLPGI